MTKTLATLTRGIIAAALVLSAGAAIGKAATEADIAGLSRSDAIKMARPLNDAGNSEVRDIPVVGTEIAGLSRSDAIKLARPLNDAGDPEVRNIPVAGIEIAGISHSDSIKLARPLGDAGDPEVRNIPVVS